MNVTVFTIGHSNHSMETFVNLLDSRQVEVVIDVRSKPWSRYTPHFSIRQLQCQIESSGRRYVFLGEELGGRPKQDEYYDDCGYALYSLMSTDQRFLEGINKVLAISSKSSTTIMCSEEDPSICHRHLLIGRVLNNREQEVLHIRKDCTIQSYTEVSAANTPEGIQLSLETIPDKSIGDETWKSVKPIR